MLALLTGGWLVHPPHSLFDNGPLWELLRKNLNFDGIPRGLYKQHLQAIGICATSYSDADSMTFYACASPIEPWTRASRKGARVQLTLDHLMASLSIPFLFRPICAAPAILRRRGHASDLALESGHPSGRQSAAGDRRGRPRGGHARYAQSAAANPPSARCSASCWIRCSWTSCIRIWSASSSYNEDPECGASTVWCSRRRRTSSEIARRHRYELPRSLRALLRTMGANNSAGTHAAELPAVRARLHPRADRARATATPERGPRRSATSSRSSERQAFCSESCRVRTCG